MRYFVDTEFHWDWAQGKITPLSMGIVAEDGRELYLVSDQIDANRVDTFVRDTVLPVIHDNIGAFPFVRNSARFWNYIKDFIGDDVPEFWGDYAAFDYVVLSMVMGDFAEWPNSWPMHINDLQQAAIPSVASKMPHHALADARAVRDSWMWFTTRMIASRHSGGSLVNRDRVWLEYIPAAPDDPAFKARGER